MESIRCSVIQGPSEECKMEINNFLNGVSCDNKEGGFDDGRETEKKADNDDGNEDVEEPTDEGKDVNGNEEEDEIEDINESKGGDGGLDERGDPNTDYEAAL
ncbi:hypothetical protein TNCV_3331441 [Trichonephila clavipes]|nr:hypothetical protein TNCV_3331441 [Trichonephila clavipes]